MAFDDIGILIANSKGAWDKARRSSSGGPRVLIATNVTGFQHASLVESLLSVALTLRGADVSQMICDASLPACLKVEWASFASPDDLLRDGSVRKALCTGCMAVGDAHFGSLNLPRLRLSQHLTSDDIANAKRICAGLSREALSALKSPQGDKVGMQGLAGALRYYARGELPTGETADNVLRRFVEAALLTATAYENLLSKETFDVAVFHHGIYVPQGPAGDVLRRHGVRVVNWNPSYRKSTFIFSEGDTYHYTLMDEPVSIWADIPWSDEKESSIVDYLKSRAGAARDWIWFHENAAPTRDHQEIMAQLGLDPKKPIIGMLSNVAWDAQLHYPANAFENIFDWVIKTFEHFAERPDLQLLLRIHPAEIRGTAKSRQPLLEVINERFPNLPANIFIIPPESPISTYAAMELCKSVLIYGTKTGVELAAIGMPVIVGGEAWIRGKGVTFDAKSSEHYRELLARLPDLPALDRKTILRARKYAYHFFFRRMIPLPFIAPEQGKIYGLKLDSIERLRSGVYPGLDAVCDGILKARDFIYEAERLGLHE